MLGLEDFNITIVGLGLIGGSFAMALKELKPKSLWAVDINKNSLNRAESMGIIDKGYTEAEIPLKESDIVIIAIYPKLIPKYIKDNINNFKKGVIITDVGGIKNELIKEVNSFIPDTIDFIGGHPMAGKEEKGLEFASKDIFRGANYIITPVEKNKAENIEILSNIARKMGCKNVIKISPQKHDEIIAFTSHLTHVIAVSIVNSDNLGVDTSSFTGGSFRDATRVAAINCDLWVELLTSNSENIVNRLEVFEQNIRSIKEAIKDNNTSFLKEEFEKAYSKRKDLI